MSEPTLSELANIPSDAALGTAGMTDYVPQMHQVNQQIFEAAKFKASMDRQKYNQALQNFKDIVKDGSEIAKMDIAAPDREYLQGQLANIFSEIEKNPKSALAGNGMFAINEKLQKLASDATQSKQDNYFDKYHRAFLDRVPDMKTDENKAKVETFLPTQKLGERQPYMLDAPIPEFDGQALFSGLLKNSTRPFAENRLNPTDAEGNKLNGYIQTETGEEVSPKTLKGLWDLALNEHPAYAKSVKKRYDNLPPEIKKQYDAIGGVPAFFSDLGKSYLQAQFPEGTYEKTKDGNYRFNKKSELKPDPNYLAAQRLAEEIKQHKAQNGLAWYNAETARINATKPKEGATTNNPDNGNIIYGINGNIPGTTMKIKDGAVIDSKTGDIMPITGEFKMPASFFDNSIFTEYNKYAGSQKMVKDENGNFVPNEAINPSRLADDGGSRTVRFKDGVVDGIKTDKGDYATVDQFGYITNQANIKGVKKYQKQVDISGGKGKTEPAKTDKSKKPKFPLPKGQAAQVKQNGVTYVYDENTGEYK